MALAGEADGCAVGCRHQDRSEDKTEEGRTGLDGTWEVEREDAQGTNDGRESGHERCRRGTKGIAAEIRLKDDGKDGHQ